MKRKKNDIDKAFTDSFKEIEKSLGIANEAGATLSIEERLSSKDKIVRVIEKMKEKISELDLRRKKVFNIKFKHIF